MEHPTYTKRRMADWIGHIFHMYCFLKLLAEGRIGGEVNEKCVSSYGMELTQREVTGN